MSNPFLGIDTARHLQIIQQACPAGWQVALVAGENVVERTEAESAGQVLDGLRAQKINLTVADGQEAVVGNDWVHLIPVLDHLKTSLGTILLYGPNGAELEGAFDRVHMLVESLQSEVGLNLELADMADELNRRHEELNLIYNTNEQPDEAADDEDVLTNIVANVVDYLEADFAILSVPSRSVWVLEAAPGVDATTHQNLMEKAEPAVLGWLREHRQPLVLNKEEDVASTGLGQTLPFRALVVPITDDRDEVIGGLALCRGHEGARIVNSDKNLLLALSRRIGKIIQVSFDPLTGLPRRMKFERMLDRAISGLMSNREQHGLIHINVDGLSAINEQYGVRTGDSAIELVAKLLAQTGRSADLCGRVGGDEICLLLLNCKQDVALSKAEDFRKMLAKQPFLAGRTRQSLRVSAGVVGVSRNTSAAEVMTKASVACGIAKERGGNVVQVYEAAYEQVEQKREEVRLLTIVRQALESRTMFQLYAQPIVPLQEEERAPHFEVLLRLFTDDGEFISPAEFIPVAEKHALMPAIDAYVLKAAVSMLGRSGILQRYPDTVCSVNLSGQSFGDDSALNDLQSILTASKVPARNLCLEVTETAAIQDLGNAQYHINAARRLGCRFALDDFGAGLSSFTYLRVLPLDYVKIDGSFVKDMLNDDIARTMVQSIHNVGSVMGLETVAEYVENEELARDLAALGIDFGQGFGLGKPIPFADFVEDYLAASIVLMAEAANRNDSVVLRSSSAHAAQLRPTFALHNDTQFEAVKKEVARCVNDRDLRIILELTATRTVNSALLEFLLDVNDALRARGGWLQIAKVNAVCAEVFRVTGLSESIALLDVDSTQVEQAAVHRQRLGDILVARGLVSEAQIEEALTLQKQHGKKLGEILIAKRWVTDQDVLSALSGQLSIPQVAIRAGLFDPDVINVLDSKAAKRLVALPLFKVRGEITIATPNAQNVPVLKEIQDLTGCKVRAVFAPREKVLEYATQSAETTELGLELLDTEGDDLELVEAPEDNFSAIDEIASGSPVVNLVNSLIQRAIREGASDVHIESFRDKGRVRFRIDGVLYEVMTLRAELMPAFVSRLKVMANLDIAERRLPQDGRMQVVTGGRSVDLRFSSMPALFGEKVVLRILDKNAALLDINQLGMDDDNRTKYEGLMERGYGLILVTGPTGSGKTTSLYAALNRLNTLERNIITIEDPVEYQMEIINQNEVRPAVGLTFASILKHALRQDPDIIMVGEIREHETANIAVQAALTGHLVLSTLHTNDSVGAITRLIDMGIEPYLLSSALVGVMAQRLVRTVCPSCKSSFIAPGELVAANPFDLYADTSRPLKLAKGRGCGECYDSGYKGRAAIHEVIETTDELQRLIVTEPSRDELEAYLRDAQVRTLYEDGVRRVVRQETTIEEIKRVINN